MNSSLRFRLKAFGYHLALSLLIALISLNLVFELWYISPLAKAVGVTHVFIMMLIIDAILGPLLTLIIAKQGKKSLKFDLAVIIVLQLSAYIYGMYNIAHSRPVYIAFDTFRFEVVQANNIPKASLEAAVSPYNVLGWGQPKFVAVKPAETIAQKNNRLFIELETGVAPTMQPDLYVPLKHQWSNINQKAQSLSELYDNNSKSAVDNVLKKHPNTIGWLPLIAYEQNMVVLIDSNSIIDIVDLRP